MDQRTKLALLKEWNRLGNRAIAADDQSLVAEADALYEELSRAGVIASRYDDRTVVGRANLAALEAEVAALDASAVSGLDDDTVTKLVLDMKINEVEALRSEIEMLRPTLRDQFAMAALTGMLANPEHAGTNTEFAEDAYQQADAMLTARAPQPAGDGEARIRELEEALKAWADFYRRCDRGDLCTCETHRLTAVALRRPFPHPESDAARVLGGET